MLVEGGQNLYGMKWTESDLMRQVFTCHIRSGRMAWCVCVGGEDLTETKRMYCMSCGIRRAKICPACEK